jgi:hypothetical protein
MAAKKRSRKGKKRGKSLNTAQLTKRVRRLERLTNNMVKRKRKGRSQDQILMHGIGPY